MYYFCTKAQFNPGEYRAIGPHAPGKTDVLFPATTPNPRISEIHRCLPSNAGISLQHNNVCNTKVVNQGAGGLQTRNARPNHNDIEHQNTKGPQGRLAQWTLRCLRSSASRRRWILTCFTNGFLVFLVCPLVLSLAFIPHGL
jgi:hypothetical protein